jgi:hypothetical protein
MPQEPESVWGIKNYQRTFEQAQSHRETLFSQIESLPLSTTLSEAELSITRTEFTIAILYHEPDDTEYIILWHPRRSGHFDIFTSEAGTVATVQDISEVSKSLKENL